MCVTLPARVVAVDAGGATVESDGRLRRAATLVHPEVVVGDWVMVMAGTIVQRLDPQQADEIRGALLEATRLTAVEGEPRVVGRHALG